MIVHQFGGISNRPGLHFIGPVKDHTKAPRLIPFQFKTTDTHILEFGDLYMRVISNDGHVTETGKAITGATQASPVVITATAHGFLDGEEVAIADVVGMTEINGRRFIVANKTANTFELTDQLTGANIDGAAFTGWISGGTASRIFTLATPYTQAQLRSLRFQQTADVVTIVHPSHAPAELTRIALDNWSLADIVFRPEIAFPTNIDATGGTDATATSWKITAISEENDEESLPGTSVDPAAVTITGITQADPAVVTVASHGFANGDIVNISGIVGMVELNDRHFTIANQTATTFELLGEDSTNHTAWSSVGTVAATFVEHTNSDNITLTWNAVTGASRYRIFRLVNGVWGFIASTQATTFVDVGTSTPDAADAPPALVEPFLGDDNKPSAVGFHQQRRVFGGSNNKPDTSFFSVIGSFNSFAKSVPIKADDSFSTTLASTEVNAIEYYVSLNNLLTFTSGAEWATTTSGDARFSIDTISQNPQSNWGSSDLPPIVIGATVLFAQEIDQSIRSIGFKLEIDGYSSNDLSLLVPRMFRGFTVLEWAYTKSPEPIVYLVRDDGQCLTLTFNQEQEVVAWTTWDTDGKFESVAATRPSIADNTDAAYFVIKRTIDGNTARYIERTDDRVFDDVEDAFFVDSGLSLDIPLDISGITLANPGVLTVTGHGLSNGDEVDIVDIEWVKNVDNMGNETQPDQLNKNRYKVANSTANTFTLQSIEDSSDISTVGFNAYVEGGEVRKTVLTVSNIHHLRSTPVTILADGNVITNLTVSADGVITLPRRFSRVHIGKGYISDIETLNPEPSPTTTIQGKRKIVTAVTVRFDRSRGLWVGINSDNLQEMKQREFEALGEPTQLLTGDKEIPIPSNWNTKGSVFLRQLDPLPMTILDIIPEIQISPR
jgi:hypothetical protein